MKALHLLCCLPVWAAVANAEAPREDLTQRWMSLGIGVSENANGRFGEYSQLLQTDRLFGLGELGYRWRSGEDPYQSARLEARSTLEQLGASAELARQGDYRIGLDYRHFESISREGYDSVYRGDTLQQSLPPGYSGPETATAFRADAGLQRQQGELSLMRQLGPWQLSAALASEDKSGRKVNGFSERFGDAALVAVPVDQRHDTLELTAAHAAGPWSSNLAWYYSALSNDARAFGFANPVNLEAPRRAVDLGPDNTFQRLSADGLYRVADNRHLSWFASYADARQDEDFLEPVLVEGQAVLDSLDARRVDTDLRLGFRHQLNSRLGYRLKADYRDRDNRTDVIQLSAEDYSHLYDRRRYRAQADARYRLGAGMSVSSGLEWQRVERTTRSRESYTDDRDTTRVWAALRLPSLGRLNTSLRVEGETRNSDLSAERLARLDVAAPSEALPQYLLEGRSWSYQLRGDLPLTASLSLAADYRHTRDSYDNDYYGLRGRDRDDVSVNLSWQASRDLALSAWGQYQHDRLDQQGFEFGPPGRTTYANASWRQQVRDTSAALGLNLRWQASAALEATLDISHSDNDSSYRSRWLDDADSGEAANSVDSLPGYGVDVQRVRGELEYAWSPQTDITLQYRYERLDAGDWAWQRSDFAVLAFGWASPGYEAHALLLSVHHRFPDRP